MADFHVTAKSSGADPRVRALALAAVYREILSWLAPPEKQTEPDADHLGRETASGSESATLPFTTNEDGEEA